MKSYASVESKEGDIVKCEVEMIPVMDSRPEDFASKEAKECELYTREFMFDFEEVKEGDILVVEHEGGEVGYVYGKDHEEKQRRTEIIQKLLAQI